MEDHPKRKLHISWKDALAGEAERERARIASCKPIPNPNPLKVLAANVSRECPKIKASSLRLLGSILPRKLDSSHGRHSLGRIPLHWLGRLHKR